MINNQKSLYFLAHSIKYYRFHDRCARCKTFPVRKRFPNPFSPIVDLPSLILSGFSDIFFKYTLVATHQFFFLGKNLSDLSIFLFRRHVVTYVMTDSDSTVDWLQSLTI